LLDDEEEGKEDEIQTSVIMHADYTYSYVENENWFQITVT
jgi:hypothetical protein